MTHLPNDDDDEAARKRRFIVGLQMATTPTLVDLVEDIACELDQRDPAFRGFLTATTDAEAVEGSLSADDFGLAQAVRTCAQAHGNKRVADVKLAPIFDALCWALLRQRIGPPARWAGALVATRVDDFLHLAGRISKSHTPAQLAGWVVETGRHRDQADDEDVARLDPADLQWGIELLTELKAAIEIQKV